MGSRGGVPLQEESYRPVIPIGFVAAILHVQIRLLPVVSVEMRPAWQLESLGECVHFHVLPESRSTTSTFDLFTSSSLSVLLRGILLIIQS